jgi:hypothetical protein
MLDELRRKYEEIVSTQELSTNICILEWVGELRKMCNNKPLTGILYFYVDDEHDGYEIMGYGYATRQEKTETPYWLFKI